MTPASVANAELFRWGSISRRSRSVSTWLFYADDYKFSALWSDPSKIMTTQCKACGELNWSLNDDSPPALAIWETYRKRWVSAYWQRKGIRIFVDMNVPEIFDDINMLGVPCGWQAYCTRASDYEIYSLERQYEIACAKAGSRDLTMIVYAGGGKVREFCMDNGLIYIPNSGSKGCRNGTGQ